MNPEPMPFAPPTTPPSLRAVMVTTAGITLATAVITALDSSRCTWLTEVPVGPFGELPVGVRRRFATAAADRQPETMAVTSAMVTTDRAPRPRRSRGAGGGAGAAAQAGGAAPGGRVGLVG